MILDLGQLPSLSDMVRVTADYSNAVLVGILPYVFAAHPAPNQ
jgi:hypothetical protein